METYLRSLEIEIEFGFPDAFTTPRVAQQTQKTNQFNLTTRRYTEAEISTLAAEQGSDVVWMRLADRFGDDGIVGTCIVRYEGDRAEFDTFLLSCRVLGRGAERALLAEALTLARARGCTTAVGVYLKRAKNGQVQYFYRDNGFQEDLQQQSEDQRVFTADLRTHEVRLPAYFKSVKGLLPRE